MSYFTYAAILGLLENLQARFGLLPLRDWRGNPGIVLRHDVDLDPEPALAFAQRQAERGLHGTYFFLVTADTYNCQSEHNRAIIRAIAELGMEIALHFDPSIYRTDDLDELGRRARAEAAQLEDICGERLVSVSLHNPSVANRYPLLPGWRNAYHPDIFSPQTYLSDSRMRFAHDPATFFDQADRMTFQLTLHPLHYAECEALYPKPFLHYLHRAAVRLDNQFAGNSTYAERVSDGFFAALRDEVASWDKDRAR